jgi:hypothetical protein
VTGLINFAPIRLQTPPHVITREVCFICELAVLSHLIHHAEENAASEDPTVEGSLAPPEDVAPETEVAVG